MSHHGPVPSFVHDFFVQYADALLRRDADTLADLYSVPALILFPGNHIAVGSRDQTRTFFESAWAQYEGVDAVTNEAEVVGEAPATLWVDVVWSYQGEARERFIYQLVQDMDEEWRIAVLTPLTV
jgi:ketosteroid isomerase-like protein